MKNNNRDVFTIGIDIGGTKMDTALIDSAGNIIYDHYRLHNPAKDPEQTITDLIDSIKICCQKTGKPASAIGICIAGQIDNKSGVVHQSPNLPAWHDVPLRFKVEAAFNIPVTVNNDVRVITWGEWKHGAGKGVDDLVCVFVGTGVGGGVVSNSRLLEGCTNTAGELGHMTVVAGGRKCRCRNEGCLEAYAGGWAIAERAWAIAERAQDAVRANPSGGQALIAMAGDISQISAITVSQAYKNGDPLAQRLIKDTSRYLAAGLVSIVNAFNPCLIILGGSVISGLPDIVTIVEKRVQEHALQTPLKGLRITTGALGNKAGVIGAAALARDTIGENKK
jgi:glucokinase